MTTVESSVLCVVLHVYMTRGWEKGSVFFVWGLPCSGSSSDDEGTSLVCYLMLISCVTGMCGEVEVGIWEYCVYFTVELLVLAIIERGIERYFSTGMCNARDSRRMSQIVNVAWLSVDLSPRWMHKVAYAQK